MQSTSSIISGLSLRRSGFVLFVLLFLFFPQSIFASYDFNANCEKAYQLIFKYKLDEADAILKRELQQNPKNRIPDYLYSFSDMMKTFFEEDPSQLEGFKKRQDQRRERISDDAENNPYYRFCLAEINLHTAIVLVKFNENFGAAWDVSKGYRLLIENQEKFPGFLPNEKDLLVLQAAVGTVPDSYRWALKIVGFTGELKPSVKKYSQLVADMKKSREYDIHYRETGIIYSFMQFYLLNKPDDAWKLIDEVTSDYNNNALAAYVRAVMAIRVKKNEELVNALTIYTQGQEPPMPHMDYMLGAGKLARLETDAGFYLGRFLKKFKGKNSVKDAYLRLGWSFLFQGDMESYKQCVKLAVKYGTNMTEEDKYALKEAKRDYLPNITLLRARLLFDGGFYQRAKQELLQKPVSSLSTDIEKAEYHYRLGRIQDGLGNYDEAIYAFDITIKNYSHLKEIFAPASALYGGLVWEKKGNASKAKEYYNKCLTYSGYPYKDSYDQKAYAGLERLQ